MASTTRAKAQSGPSEEQPARPSARRDSALREQALTRALERSSLTTRRLVLLIYCEYSQREAADELGVSEARVAQLLKELRHKTAEEEARGDGADIDGGQEPRSRAAGA